MQLNIRAAAVPVLTGLTGSAGVRVINLRWDIPTNAEHARTIVYRHTSNVASSATQIASVTSNSHADVGVSVVDYYYWIASANIYGRVSAKTGPVLVKSMLATELDIAENAVKAAQLDVAGVDTDGKIIASQIAAGTIAAGVVYAGTISASQINAGTLSANRVNGGTLTGVSVNLGPNGNFQITSGGVMTAYSPIMSCVTVGNLVNPSMPSVDIGATLSTAAPSLRVTAQNGQNAIHAIGPAYVTGNLTVGGSIIGTISNANYATSAGSASYASSSGSATTATTTYNPSGNAIVRNSNNYAFTVQTDGNLVYYTGGGGVIWQSGTSASDYRLKEMIAPTSATGLGIVNALEVVDFQWKPEAPLYDEGKTHVGFIAQQVQEVVPDVVRVTADTYLIQKDDLIPFAVKAIQELCAEIQELKARIDVLEAQ